MSGDYHETRRQALGASTPEDRMRRIESEVYGQIQTWAVDLQKPRPGHFQFSWNSIGTVLTVTFGCGDEEFVATNDRGDFWVDQR